MSSTIAAVAGCGGDHEQPAAQNADMSVQTNVAAGQLPPNADIETLPPDESSGTSSGELNAGADNNDMNAGDDDR